jgi:hypothetical protein
MPACLYAFMCVLCAFVRVLAICGLRQCCVFLFGFGIVWVLAMSAEIAKVLAEIALRVLAEIERCSRCREGSIRI